MNSNRNFRTIARLSVAFVLTAALAASSVTAANAGTGTISIDASAVQGVIQPTVVGQMAEWAYDEMNGAWDERLRNRSFETESVKSSESTLYDSFTGTSLDRSNWTPLSLDSAPAGTASVSGSKLTLTAASNGRWGVMSDNLGDTWYTQITVETKITGTNAILSMYGETGAGDFTKFVDFAIEGGVLKVYADGVTDWTGPPANTPATLKVVVSPKQETSRNMDFYYNGSLVHTMIGNTLLPDEFSAFIYGWSGSVDVAYVTVAHDDTYDSFGGTSLFPRWTPTRLAGSTAEIVSVASGRAQVTGTANSRYALLSDYIRNTAVDWTTVTARLQSVNGTNGLINLYGGNGAGDFSKFIEFGVEGGVAKAFGSDGCNWTGGAVTLPVALAIQASPNTPMGGSSGFWSTGEAVPTFCPHLWANDLDRMQ